VSSPASAHSLTLEILKSAEIGEVQRVEKCLVDGRGRVDQRRLLDYYSEYAHGQASGVGLLHAAVLVEVRGRVRPYTAISVL